MLRPGGMESLPIGLRRTLAPAETLLAVLRILLSENNRNPGTMALNPAAQLLGYIEAGNSRYIELLVQRAQREMAASPLPLD